ncbi:MAG: trypsin-like peptidase domain-containing protein [Pseudobacteriovorax sp.]|nr:trypsin-like peptidase domain-containing protein [Pseudobacteriovorax sp.]
MIKFISILWCMVFLAACEPKKSFELDEVRRSVFKIYVVSADPSYVQPWQFDNERSSSGSGFYIGGNRIMTNAHVVAHGKVIRVQRDGDANSEPAKVEFIAHDADLAILQVEPADYFKGSKTLEFGDFPKLQSKVATVGYPTGGEQISVTQGIVSRIGFRRYVHSGFDEHLLIQVDSAINPGNSGGPVFLNNRVVGVAFQANTSAENTGYIIPTLVVRRFLKDIEDGVYDGHPVDGIIIGEDLLSDANIRKHYGLESSVGVVVSDVTEYAPYQGLLHANDIITHVDEYEIGVDGKIDFRGERLSFKTIADLKLKSESVKLTVLRSKQSLVIEIPLMNKKEHYYRGNLFHNRPSYIVYGGLVFSLLSRNYLEGWGKKWYRRAPLHLRYLHYYGFKVPRFQDQKDIVVLSDVLVDEINTAAQSQVESVLDQVNSEKITSLKQLHNILGARGEEQVLELKFWRSHKPVVMDWSNLESADPRINETYGVDPEYFLNEGA